MQIYAIIAVKNYFVIHYHSQGPSGSVENLGYALGFQHSPQDLANVNGKSCLIPILYDLIQLKSNRYHLVLTIPIALPLHIYKNIDIEKICNQYAFKQN